MDVGAVDAADDLAAFGVPADVIDGWSVGDADDPSMGQFGVYPDCWPVLMVFLSMSTQWRWTGGMEPRRCGLEYGSLQAVYGAHGTSKKDQARMFSDLRAMEAAALDAWSKATSKR